MYVCMYVCMYMYVCIIICTKLQMYVYIIVHSHYDQRRMGLVIFI